ncbi:MAG: porin family protein [Tatlockia sp.]|nr:porin family protein [Tatlockia sp.]
MKTVLFSATLLASSLAAAATPIDGWYGSAFGGYSYLSNLVEPNRIHRHFIFNTYDRANFRQNLNVAKTGYNAGGRFGFQGGPLRYEAEVTYINAETKNGSHHRSLFPYWQANRGLHHSNNQTTALFGLANVYFDFPALIPCISPFLGLGIGYGWVEAKLNWPSDLTLLPRQFRASDSAFAYQGTAGLTFNFAEAWALNVAYRYLGTTKLDKLGNSFQGNLVSVGMVYRFNEYNYK